jgi:exopolysaccharide production protein ExoY
MSPVEGFIWPFVAFSERLAACILLSLLFPVLIVACTIIVILSRRSPLVAHCRVGQNGRPIWVLKLRTMWDGKPLRRTGLVEKLPVNTCGSLIFKTRKDLRVKSRFAAACRRYSLDEVPQLWHVIRGEMALIGPRPLTWNEIHCYYASAADEFLARKPGLSGLWQVRGRSRLTYGQRRRLDLFMIRQWSLRLYFKILFDTIPTVLTGRNAW